MNGKVKAIADRVNARPRSAEAAPFNLTDSGNAEYLAHLHGNDLRYDHRRARWLLWQGHRWQPDADAEVQRLAKAAMRERFKDAAALDDPNARVRAAKWATASESRTGLNNLLSCAQAERPIADKGDAWDADAMLLGVPNGVVDLRTGALRSGRREDRMTMSAAVAYDPDATCPRFEAFLSEVFDDAVLADFVQRAVGYSPTGSTTEQCLFLLHGHGANGKGTLMQALTHVFGEYGDCFFMAARCWRAFARG
jgi:putative DNA primase/helicase